MYCYSVAPKSKTMSQDTYDYLSDEALPIGAIVEMPLGRTKTLGVIIGKTSQSKFATKKILRKISLGAAFTSTQIALAKTIQDEYLSAFGETLFSFLPIMNIGDIKKISAIRSVSKRKAQKGELFLSSQSNRLNYYSEVAANLTGQVLFILPEIKEIEDFRLKLKKLLPNKTVLAYHSRKKSEEKFKIWQRLLSGEPIIIIASRQGALLPFTDLSLTCIDDPLNFSYGEDQSPYYQAFFVLRKLHDLMGGKIIIGQNFPDTSSYIAHLKGKLYLKTLKPMLKIKTAGTFNKFAQNLELLGEIKKTISRRGRICFVGPWKNQIRIVCKDCSNQIICRQCKSKYFDENSLNCATCGKQIQTCNSCRSHKLRKIGFSYKTIEDKIGEVFPEYKDKISSGAEKRANSVFIVAAPNEIAQTSLNFDIAIFPNFDRMADFPAIGYKQKIFHLIYDLPKYYVKSVFLMGEDLTENTFATQIKNFNFKDFLNEEIKTRNDLSIPPFGYAVEVLTKSRSEKTAIEEINKISKEINKELMIISGNGADMGKIKALFFVKNKDWPKLKEKLKSTKVRNIYFRINQGDYL